MAKVSVQQDYTQPRISDVRYRVNLEDVMVGGVRSPTEYLNEVPPRVIQNDRQLQEMGWSYGELLKGDHFKISTSGKQLHNGVKILDTVKMYIKKQLRWYIL